MKNKITIIVTVLLVISVAANGFLLHQCKVLQEQCTEWYKLAQESAKNFDALISTTEREIMGNAHLSSVKEEGISVGVANGLPCKVSLIGYESIRASSVIEKITYTTTRHYDGTYELTFYFAGTKTHDEEGVQGRTPCHFHAVLYDQNGNIFTTEIVAGAKVTTGTEFEDVYCKFNNLPDGSSWTLKIKDLD